MELNTRPDDDECREALVIGVGNEFRRDDGVGPIVAERLGAMSLEGVRVCLQSGEGASLMESWSGVDAVVIIDAARSSSKPGTIHRFEAGDTQIPSEFFHYSTHAFSVAEAVELARALGRLPKRLILYGIEGGDFSTGRGLSDEVERASTQVVELIREDLKHYCRQLPA
jgi:hydrogenase maturation protease